MQPATREMVMDWVRDRRERRIRLRVRGSPLTVTGVCGGLEELDACSTEFNESRIAVAVPGVEISLTFHAKKMALQMLASVPGDSRSAVSIPVSIAYEDVILEEVSAGENVARPEPAAAEPQRTPYQLLHPDS